MAAWKRVAVSAVLIATAGAALLLYVRRPTSHQRPFEGRITRFPDGMFRSTLASITARKPAAPVTADDFHAAGVTQLVSGRTDAAIAAFVQALTITTGVRDADRASSVSNDAALLTDLSAAYLQRGTSMGHASDSVRALQCAERAWRLRQTPETAWNRALALHRLHLHDDARETWRRYLQIEESEEWASEGRKRLSELRAPQRPDPWPANSAHLHGASSEEIERLARLHPLRLRKAAEKDILRAWAEAVRRGDAAGTARELQTLDRIGAALVRRSGESLVADVSANLREVADQAMLAEAILLVAEAKAAYDQGDGAGCRAKLRAAIPKLRRCRSPFVYYARFYVASSYYFDNDYVSLRAEAARLSDIPGRYVALHAQTSWIRGLGEMSSGRPDGALRHYEQARATFDRLGELDYVATVHNMIAEAYDYLDSADAAWMHRERAMALSSQTGSSSAPWVQLLQGSAQLLLARQQPEVARIMLDRTLRLTADADNPMLYTDTIAWRAVALHQLGRPAEAQAEFQRAEEIARTIRVAGVRERALNTVTLTRALTLEREIAPREVAAAVAFARNSDNRWALPRLLRLQSDVAARAGDYDGAMRGYSAAIEEIVRQRRSTTLIRFELLNRLCLSDVTENAIALAINRGDGRAAFDFSEHSTGAAFPAPRPAPSATIPPNVAVVKIVSLSNRLVVWILTSRGVTTRTVAMPIERVRRAAEDMRSSHEAAALLGVAFLDGRAIGAAVDTLVFVADATVAAVPFEELVHPSTGRPLIERYVVAESPTVAAYLRTVARNVAGDAAPALLVEGAPANGMPRLHHAAKEIRRLQRLYRHPAVWNSEAEDIRTLGDALEEAGMIHFAAHGVVDRDNELLSNIVLGDGNRLLYAHEVAALRLRRRPIVVLSTCSGAAPAASRRRRAPTLADAFLAAGASAVVASSDRIDDRQAKRFSLLLHERLQRGMAVGEALREIQILFARDGLPWSDFVVVGNPEATVSQYMVKPAAS